MNRENMPADDAQQTEFMRLLTSHQLDLYLFIRSLVLDLNEVAEIVQNTNLALWEKRDQYEAGRDFRAWAFQFARNKVLQHRDQNRRKQASFSDLLIDELTIHAPDFSKADNPLIDDLRRCIAELAAKDRELLRRRYSLAETCDSIAEAVGRPVRWVYKSLGRIRRELHDCMARHSDAWREP